MKKTRVKKSRDTVPLKASQMSPVLLYSFCGALNYQTDYNSVLSGNRNSGQRAQKGPGKKSWAEVFATEFWPNFSYSGRKGVEENLISSIDITAAQLSMCHDVHSCPGKMRCCSNCPGIIFTCSYSSCSSASNDHKLSTYYLQIFVLSSCNIQLQYCILELSWKKLPSCPCLPIFAYFLNCF
jgi:hypothetical protein